MAAFASTWYCASCDKEMHTSSKESFPLKCSHVLCRSCMTMCNVNSRCNQCPACRKLAPSPPMSRSSREIIIRETEISESHGTRSWRSSSTSRRESVRPPVPPRPMHPPPPSGESFSKKMENYIQKTTASCTEDIDKCKMVSGNILSEKEISDDFKNDVTKLKKVLKEMEEQLKKDKEDVDKVSMWLENQDRILGEEHRHVEEKSKKLRAFQHKTELVQNYDEVSALIDQDPHVETNSLFQVIDNLLQKHKSMRERFRKIIQDRVEKVNLIQEFMVGAQESEDIGNILESVIEEHYVTPLPTVTVLRNTLEDMLLTREMTVDDLQKMKPEVRYQVGKGKVFVAQNYKGRQRYAKVMLSDEGDEVLLGHLGEPALPDGVHILQYSDIMEQRKPSTQQAFLSLSSKRSQLGKLYIRLLSDSPRCRQFHLLCTGEMGSSYANTRILEVVQKGHHKLEYIRCGDYEYNDGTGGCSLVPVFTDEQEVEGFSPSLAGTLSAVNRENHIGAQFRIHTRHDTNRKSHLLSFGKVEKGHQVLNRVICQYQNISEVFVEECGIVLWRFGCR